MSLHLKRTVLFFCVFHLGLGGCLGNLAMANDLFTIFLSGIHNQVEVNDLVVIPISPTGTIYTSTPTYKWVADEFADKYCLVVNHLTQGTYVVDTCYTDSEANCNSGTCSVTPGTSLADGNATWNIRAIKGTKTGQYSFMKFIVSAGPQDPILGLWDAGDGGQALMAESTTGGYNFVATITVQGTGWWKQRNIEVGDVAWKLNKQPNGHYKGETAVNGNYSYWWPMEVVIQGNQMIDTTGKLVGTKIH